MGSLALMAKKIFIKTVQVYTILGQILILDRPLLSPDVAILFENWYLKIDTEE